LSLAYGEELQEMEIIPVREEVASMPIDIVCCSCRHHRPGGCRCALSTNRFGRPQELIDMLDRQTAAPMLQMGAGGDYPRRDREVVPPPSLNCLPEHPLVKLQFIVNGTRELPHTWELAL
jgi:hypothetical protein